MLRSNRWATVVLLLLALSAGLLLRVWGTAQKRYLTHDEGISFLAATGHQGEYAAIADGRYPSSAWAKAGAWQRLLRVEQRFCFEQIAADLARFDIHPPLYFWLLHLWAIAFGLGPAAGPALNTIIAALTALALFGLARRLLHSRAQAAAVSFTWLVSPAVLPISLEARQYDLLALCSVLLVWQILRISDTTRPAWRRDFGLLALITLAGTLTHYQFALIAAGALCFLALRLARKKLTRLLWGVGAVAAGYLVFVQLQPDFYLSLARQQSQLMPFELREFPLRLLAVCEGLAGFLLPASLTRLPALAVIFALGLAACLSFLPWRALRLRGEKVLTLSFAGERAAYFFFIWIAGAILLLYLAGLSPAAAMGRKYLAAAWPFLAFIPVSVARCFGNSQRLALALFCALLLIAGGVNLAQALAGGNATLVPPAEVTRADTLLVDSVARGVLPRIVWYLPPETTVFAAPQSFLLQHQSRWLDRLQDGAYVGVSIYGGAPAGQAQIVKSLSQQRRVLPQHSDWQLGAVYQVTAPAQ